MSEKPMTPTTVRTYIESYAYATAGGVAAAAAAPPLWGINQVTVARGIVKYANAMDPRLLAESLSPGDRMALEHELFRLEVFARQGESYPGPPNKEPALHADGPARIHAILSKIPKDEATPQADQRLLFITNEPLRRNVARDIDSIAALIGDAEWKAATVIAGSVIEAVLLWQVQNSSGYTGVVAMMTGRKFDPDAAKWGLEGLLQASRKLGLLTDEELKLCSVAQVYRNLIHPGQERAKHPPARSTALAAQAAVERLLEKWH